MLLLMLWQPALSVTTLRPQQNIVAVVADDSRSMAAGMTVFPGANSPENFESESKIWRRNFKFDFTVPEQV